MVMVMRGIDGMGDEEVAVATTTRLSIQGNRI